MAVFGGSGGTYVLRLKPSLKITDYMKVAKLPPPLKTSQILVNLEQQLPIFCFLIMLHQFAAERIKQKAAADLRVMRFKQLCA